MRVVVQLAQKFNSTEASHRCKGVAVGWELLPFDNPWPLPFRGCGSANQAVMASPGPAF